MEHETFSDFDGLALFIRIVQAGGLASAERATGIPKATLSAPAIGAGADPERPACAPDKKGVGTDRTRAALFERGQTAFMLAEQAVAEVQDDRVALSGTVSLVASPGHGDAALAPALMASRPE